MKLRRILLMTTIFIVTALASAQASVTVTLYDANKKETGDLLAFPGSTVGWGVKLVNDATGFALFTGSDFTSIGGTDLRSQVTTPAYTDFLAGLILAPNESYLADYSAPLILGAGSIAIGNYQLGVTMTGAVSVLYDYFSVSPTNPAFNPETDSLGSRSDLAAASVTTAVPEPSTYAFVAMGLGMLGFVRRKRV